MERVDVVAARAAWIATVRAQPLATMAQLQTKATVVLPAGRGTIFDSMGAPLALGEQATTVAANPREVRHPFACFTQPVRLTNRAETGVLPKTFVYCSSPATGSFDAFAARYRSDPAWRFHELKTGHDAMILMPEEVARVLQAA